MKDPWSVPPLLALKKMAYVCFRKQAEADGTNSYDLTSDAVDINKLGPNDLEGQIRSSLESGQEHELAAKPLDKEWAMACDTNNQDAWKLKALEHDRAIGGLRNPHLSIQKSKGDLTTVDQLRAIIDAKVTAC